MKYDEHEEMNKLQKLDTVLEARPLERCTTEIIKLITTSVVSDIFQSSPGTQSCNNNNSNVKQK